MRIDGLASARVDLSFMDRARVALASPDLRPAWKELRKPVRADIRQHARKQEGPDATWPAMGARTKARARAGRKRPRKLLGRLPSALTTKLERRRMLVRSLVKWSAVHAEGGRAGKGAKIPARPWLWISGQTMEHAARVIAKGLAYLIEVG